MAAAPTRPTRPALTVSVPGKQLRRRAMASGTELLYAGWRLRLPGLLSGSDCLLARQATAPPGDGIRHGAAFIPGGGRLTRPTTPNHRWRRLLKLPVLAASTSLRRSRRRGPHGCGLRAVFCRDAASARPEACRDKSKGPRSGDVAGRSLGYRGGGDCRPCALPAP